MTRQERARRAKNALILGGYGPSERKAQALVEALFDLYCLAREERWPWDLALQRALQAAGSKEPVGPAETAAPREPWVLCQACRMVHPEWAACLPADGSGRLVRLALSGGRTAAYLEAWYARLPGALVQAESKMRETDQAAGGRDW